MFVVFQFCLDWYNDTGYIILKTIIESTFNDINSYPPSAAYLRRWTVSALVQKMACRLFDARPLTSPMLTYCHLDP